MHGGALLMYININLAHRHRPDLEISCEDSVSAEIKVKEETYLIGLFYSPVTAEAVFLTVLMQISRKPLKFPEAKFW